MSIIGRLPAPPRFPDAPSLQPVSLNVPFISQFTRGHGFDAGKTACLAASRAMLHGFAHGRFTLSYDRIQVGYREDGSGRIISFGHTGQALTYIDRELDAGRPVVVGVSHGDYAYGDKVTDHFVVISGRIVGPGGAAEYSFLDPGTADPSYGSDRRDKNRFIIDPRTKKLVRVGRPGVGAIYDRRYEVSAVLKNAISGQPGS